ncbi:hypothetical protein [Maioricimonas sp. JC845]|uniref:hypothetical protein n=1 Tax=Maioricimonas sp. JC845 TaxID=3232138 RepID=UPI00345766C0
MLAAIDLTARLWHLLELVVAIVQPVLLLALCLGVVLASAHLLTMLGTRWGDRRVSSKALFFSIAVHLSMTCGIVALVPEYRAQLFRPRDSSSEERIQLETLMQDPVERAEEGGDRPVAVWEQLPETVREDLERLEREFNVPDDEAAERTRMEPPAPDPADIAYRPDMRLEQPLEPLATDAALPDVAAVPMEIDNPLAEARREVDVPSVARERSTFVAEGQPDQDDAPRPAPGGVDRLSDRVDLQPDLRSMNAALEEQALVQRSDDSDRIDRREAPAESELTAPQAGANAPETDRPGAASAPTKPRIARQRTRTPVSPSEAGLQRFRPTTAPSVETPVVPAPDNAMLALTPSVRPEIERPQDPSASPDGEAGGPYRVPAEYRLRSSENREEAAKRFGGTDDSERAVQASLLWLKSIQHRDGYWDAGAYGGGQAPEATSASDRPNVGADSDAGVTALAVLAFLGAGHTPDRGEHSETVERALRWLVARQRDDGFLGGEASATAAMYCHGIATFALAESYGLRSDPLSSRWLRQPVEKAIAYIADQQLEDGGWRYEKGQPDGDMSMFGWQLMALKSAEIAGVTVPTGVKDRMIRFLRDRSLGTRNGLASYRLGREFPITPAMTAEALFCKQMLGISRENPASTEAVAYLVRHLPKLSETNYYFWYYGTLSMFHYGGEEWERWNNGLRDLLVSTQVNSGQFAGSWEPRGPWGPYGGRIYTTAIATLCLEVYYRYLPLYQASDDFGRN